MFDGIVKILCNVKHVHGHERNLISLDRPYSMNYYKRWSYKIANVQMRQSKLIGETIKGEAKCKDASLSKTQQRKNNHGCRRVRFEVNMNEMVVQMSLNEKFRHCVNSIYIISC